MRFFVWNPWKIKIERPARRAGRPGFVPRLEVLEDRCLPSVDPIVIFDPGTTWQPVGSSASPAVDSVQTSSLFFQANVNATITYGLTGLPLVSYFVNDNANAFLPITEAGTWMFSTPALAANDAISNQIRLSLILSSSQLGIADTAQIYNISAHVLNTSNGVAVKITVASPDMGSVAGHLNVQVQGDSIPTFANSSANPDLTSSSEFLFSNSTGVAGFTILLPGVSAPQNTTASGAKSDSFVGHGLANYLNPAGVSLINSFQIISNYFGSVDHQASSIRQPMSNFNSLVLADNSPGLYLTLSITHEISQRSSSPAAQATWTGLRPPLESLLRPELPASHAALPADQQDKNASAIAEVNGQDEAESRPMEIMVATILEALQQGKVDDRAKDIGQTAVRDSAPADPQGEPLELRSLVFWPWEQGQTRVPGQRSDPEAFAIAVLPLNDFLDHIALRESSNSRAPEESLEPKPNELSQPHPSVASRPRWLHLAESLITVLMAVGWTSPARLAQFISCKPGQRTKNGIVDP
jgi:hypothetical protein